MTNRLQGEKPKGETFSLVDERVGVDVLEGLVLHQEVIDEQFENDLIAFVQRQCEKGRKGVLKKPTYLRASGARSQGNQREAIMYGGFFDFNRARPGKRGLVPPFPPILERLVAHLVDNHYLPAEVRPDSCIINQYNAGDCIPPHVDHSSYYRPISTLSLLGEEPMLVGSRFRTVKSCNWVPICGKSVSLARRSLLVLGGNSGNTAKHCISACKGQRISITLRKQPPPDWKPDESELVGKGGQRRLSGAKRKGGGGEESGGGRVEGDEYIKKRSLSGSAKRRKKMAKIMAMKDSDRNQSWGRRESRTSDNGSNSSSSSSNNNSSGGMFATQNISKKQRKELARKASEIKKREKQARRNARRLEKKKMAGIKANKTDVAGSK